MPTIKREMRDEIPDTALPCSRCYSAPAIYQLVLYINGKKRTGIRRLARCRRCALNAARYYDLRMPK